MRGHIYLGKQLLPQINDCCQEVLQNDEMTSLWSNHCWMLAACIWRNDYQVAMLALNSKSWDYAKHVRDHHFQEQWLGVERCYLIFCILRSVSVDQSGGLSMEIGILYFSHAMLVPAELIVCSTRRFACIVAK